MSFNFCRLLNLPNSYTWQIVIAMTKYMRSYCIYHACTMYSYTMHVCIHTCTRLIHFMILMCIMKQLYYISIIKARCSCESCMAFRAKQLCGYNLLYIATHDFLALIPYTNLYKAKHSYNKHNQYNYICYNMYVYIAVPV